MATLTKISGALKEEQQYPLVVRKDFLSGIFKTPCSDTSESVQALLIALGRSTWLTAFVKRSAHFVQFGSPFTFTQPKRRP